jgi:hypothetical protein
MASTSRLSIASASASDSLESDATSTGLGVILLEGDECKVGGLDGKALVLLLGCPLELAIPVGGKTEADAVQQSELSMGTMKPADALDMSPTPSELGEAGGKMASDGSKRRELRRALDSV